MTFTLQNIRFNVLPMRLRFPFRYGIASMTALPHLFVSVDLIVDGKQVTGIASEGLAPKWFTKDPYSSCEQDLAEMLAVIQNGARIAQNAARQPTSFFAWWQALYEEQKSWSTVKGIPALLANLGVSLIERSILDGLCKASGLSLHALLVSDKLQINLGAVRAELEGLKVSEVLPSAPLSSIAVRHTVGLGDPLRTQDIPAAETLNDGLPHSLEDSIRAYGLKYFKIKVCGKPEADLARLREITAVITQGCPGGFHATLDGNEQFNNLATFRTFYEELSADPQLSPLFRNLLLIEQPLHRNNALANEVRDAIAEWKDGPGLIIDEADGSLDDLPRALDLGYCGTSHKNCKGIVKGLANAALLRVRSATMQRRPILSGEDLANVGPIALLQDLAMMAALGVTHVERNGHHYFRGLSMYPAPVQEQVLNRHQGLYRRTEAGDVTLQIQDGQLDLTSVNTAPFGAAIDLDVTQFSSLKEWIYNGGMSQL